MVEKELRNNRLLAARSVSSFGESNQYPSDSFGISVRVNGEKKVVCYSGTKEDPAVSQVARTGKEALQHVFEKFPEFNIEENLSVSWDERDADFKKILKVKEIIDLDLGDDDFIIQLPELKKILLSTFIFKKLDDKNIQVTKAHNGETPFEHTINVLKKLKTTGLPKEVVKAVRWAAVWHDIGKIFGATYEFGRFHSQLSTYISWEFFYEHCKDLSPQLIQQILFAIQFHHTSEGFNLKWLGKTEEDVNREAQNRLQRVDVVTLLYVLSTADILSVSEYQHFVEILNNMLWLFQPELHTGIKALGLLRHPILRQPNPKADEANGQHTQPAEALTQ